MAIATLSDFGRTLTSNGRGTDHAWGGNHVVMGGEVRGGQILGAYPSTLAESDANPLNIGRGRLIPTTPWEGVWRPIAQWFGVDEPAALSLPVLSSFALELFCFGRCRSCDSQRTSIRLGYLLFVRHIPFS